MNQKIEHMIRILESWEKAYLPPSATMAVTEAKNMIRNLCQEIDMLTNLTEDQQRQIDELTKAHEPKAKVQTKKAKKNEI